MHTIEVDFEVLKALMTRRPTETVTYNDVIRGLLDMTGGEVPPTPVSDSSIPSANDWLVKGVRFPVGTEFRATYEGKTITASVFSGRLCRDSMLYDSPSQAAMAITGYSVNGWLFWHCRVPGTEKFRVMDSFRNQ